MSRGMNYSAEELEVLVNCLLQRPNLASGKLGGDIPNKKVQNIGWEEIASKVNAISMGCVRSSQNVRAKWSDLKHRTKQKAAVLAQNRLATGGEPQENEVLSDLEQKVLSLSGSASVKDVCGGQFDVSLSKQMTNQQLNVHLAVEDETRNVLSEEEIEPSSNQPCASSSVGATVHDQHIKEQIDWSQLALSVKEEIEPSSNEACAPSSICATIHDQHNEEQIDWSQRAQSVKENSTARCRKHRERKRKSLQNEEDSLIKKAIGNQELLVSQMTIMNNNLSKLIAVMQSIESKQDKQISLLSVALNVQLNELNG